jgi:adenosylcobinamide-phosphate synthase
VVRRRHLAPRAAAVALGLLCDRAFGEPPAALHPVAGFGSVMGHVEDASYDDSVAAGLLYAGTGIALGLLAGRTVRNTTFAVSVAVAGRSLRTHARDVHGALALGDLDRARALLPALVGRDPSELDASGVAAAVIESLAENSVDAVVAPALWAFAAGSPGVLAYRAVNTMDAMVGHHSERYEQYGTGSARLDDLANWVPARVTAGLTVAARPQQAPRIVRAVRNDAPAHPSPNAPRSPVRSVSSWAGPCATASASRTGPCSVQALDRDRPTSCARSASRATSNCCSSARPRRPRSRSPVRGARGDHAVLPGRCARR